MTQGFSRALAIASVVGTMAAAPAMADTVVVPLPKVSAIPITADSYPWLYYKYPQRPRELDRFGFVEEEYLVSGSANVYDWPADPAGSLIVKYRNAPYATRILMRR